MDDEFTIIRKPKQAISDVVPANKTAPRLVPVWTDEDECYPTRNIINEPISINIEARFKKSSKLKVTENENVCSILPSVDKRVCHIVRLHDANKERLSCGHLMAVEFNRFYNMFLTGSLDTTMALFNFKGSDTTLLVDRVFERFPIKSAKFVVSGQKVILTGGKHYFKIYDINAGHDTSSVISIDGGKRGLLNRVEVSPKDDLAAFSAPNEVYIVDLRGFEKTATARISGSVESHCFSQDGDLLNAFSSDGSVFVFDLRQSARPLHRWSEFGFTGAGGIAVSSDCKYIACGSHSGYVNIYTWESVMCGSKTPKPFKTVGNLTTGVDQLLFNPTRDLLYMASSLQQGASRIFDVAGGCVDPDFPVRMGGSRLAAPTSAAFSPSGAYLAVGQASGRAALFATGDHNPTHY